MDFRFRTEFELNIN